jgi:hypothetical protein
MPNPALRLEPIDYAPQAHKREEEDTAKPATISNAYLPFDLPENEEDHEPEV